MTFNFNAFKSAKVHLYDLNQIFEKRNMDQKDIQITAIR